MEDRHAPAHRHPHFLQRVDGSHQVLLVAGLTGLILGVAQASWQWAVEVAQNQAGLVPYPVGSIPPLIHHHVWSLVDQLAAVALWYGGSERMVSLVISAVMGVLSFQALSTWTFALGRRVAISTLAPLLVVISGTMHGGTYPIKLLGTADTYGTMGLSFALLAVGLLAIGWRRSGILLTVLAPAIHPPVGLLVAAGVVAAGLLSRVDRRSLRAMLIPAMVGAIIVTASLAWHVHRLEAAGPTSPAEMRALLEAFVPYWDGHRVAVGWRSAGVVVAVLSIVLAALGLWRLPPVPAGRQFLLGFVLTSGFASLALAGVTAVPIRSLPSLLVSAMPGRFLNITGMTFTAVCLGLIGATPARRWRVASLGLVGAALLVARPSPLLTLVGHWVPTVSWTGVRQATVLYTAASVAMILTWIGSRVRATPLDAHERLSSAAFSRLVAAAAALTMLAWHAPGIAGGSLLRPSADDPVLAQAASDTGRLLTGGDLMLVQLRTRRPVLLDGGTLDTLPYALAVAPAIDRVLKEVYDLDLFHPPADARGGGRIPVATNRENWRAFTPDRWQQIGRAWNVQQVLTYGDWQLQLPIVMSSPSLHLYRIPD